MASSPNASRCAGSGCSRARSGSSTGSCTCGSPRRTGHSYGRPG
jgi:hypothetical protein